MRELTRETGLARAEETMQASFEEENAPGLELGMQVRRALREQTTAGPRLGCLVLFDAAVGLLFWA